MGVASFLIKGLIAIFVVIALLGIVGFLLRHKFGKVFHKDKQQTITPSAMEAQRVQWPGYRYQMQNHQLSIPTPSPAYYAHMNTYNERVGIEAPKADAVVRQTGVA